VKYFLLLLAGLATLSGAGPAFAFKSIEGCDVAAFASKASPVPIAPERWEAYRAKSTFLLEQSQSAAATDWRSLAASLIDAQASLLAPDKGSPAYRDYLTDNSCRVISKLDGSSIESILDEIGKGVSAPAAAALRGVTQAARTQIDRIERSARFRSGQDRTLMLAQYYCFVAGAVAGLLPPDRQKTLALAQFGATVPCKDVGRK
jgi:hypothetical protein